MSRRSEGAARRARRGGREGDQAAQAVERLATLLEAGVAPESAWVYLGEFSSHPVVSEVAGAVAGRARPVDAFAAVLAPRQPTPAGAEPTSSRVAADSISWRTLATAWAVADASGASLAPSLRELGSALHDRAETEREIEVGLAGPLATSRLVTWLPAVGLGLGVLMGVDIVGTLLGSVVGWGILVAGVGILLIGRTWTRALAKRASPPLGAPGFELDLVAVALTGGVSVARAQALVREASSRFGVDVSDAGELGRILGLAARAGAPAVDLLRSAARQLRRDARIEGRRAAASLAVRLMVPLGVCVLPSFMLLGVAPVILSIVSSTVSGF